MNKNIHNIIKQMFMFLIIFIIVIRFTDVLVGYADTIIQDITEIHTAAELVKASENQTGSYRLMADIDMTGIDWTP